MIAVIFVGCELKYPTYSWHQRMTVVVYTPSGHVYGTSVSAISWSKGFNLNIGWNSKFQGEAVVVDLGGNRYLFALLTRQSNTEYLGTVAPASIAAKEGRVLNEALFQEVSRRRGRAKGVIAVPDYQWPLMVTFTDRSNPLTVQLVNPRNLRDTFGDGYNLNLVALQITNEPVTNDHIETFLPWLKTIGGGMLDGRSFSSIKAENRLANDLTSTDFRMTR